MAFLFFWFFFQLGFNRMTQMVKLKAAMTATLILLDQTEKKANNTSFFVFSCQKKMEAEIKRFFFCRTCSRMKRTLANARELKSSKRAQGPLRPTNEPDFTVTLKLSFLFFPSLLLLLLLLFYILSCHSSSSPFCSITHFKFSLNAFKFALRERACV